jgi:DNA (cytosine-5)-methyltransferase 1
MQENLSVTESAFVLAEKSTASVQALLSQLLEIYDARMLANLLNAQGAGRWTPAIVKRLLISDRAGQRLDDNAFRFLQSLLPRPPATQSRPAFRFIDLFAGIGGIRHGFEAIGGQCVFTSEWNKYAVRTYKANWYCAYAVRR